MVGEDAEDRVGASALEQLPVGVGGNGQNLPRRSVAVGSGGAGEEDSEATAEWDDEGRRLVAVDDADDDGHVRETAVRGGGREGNHGEEN